MERNDYCWVEASSDQIQKRFAKQALEISRLARKDGRNGDAALAFNKAVWHSQRVLSGNRRQLEKEYDNLYADLRFFGIDNVGDSVKRYDLLAHHFKRLEVLAPSQQLVVI